jgi:hypothetical protein
MKRREFMGVVIAGILFAAINTFSFFTLDQPIGIGGFMGWIPSAIVAKCDEAFARGNMMFHFFFYETEAAPCIALGFSLIIGALIYSLVRRTFKLKVYGSSMCVRGLIGGILMGFSFPMMKGCNIIHIFGGLPQVAFSAFIAIGGIFIGAIIGRRIILR